MLKKARDFAIRAHGNQMYGNKPYVYHLDTVVKHLAKYSEEARVIGYLHDVLEDTNTSFEQLSEIFSPFVAECVEILSDEDGPTRLIRKTKTYEKMKKVSGEYQLALLVKAADRLANLEQCYTKKNRKMIDIYSSEHAIFRASVYRDNLCDDIWLKIEDIISKIS